MLAGRVAQLGDDRDGAREVLRLRVPVRRDEAVHAGRTGFAAREVMTLTLACDHRAVDGTYAAAFLNDVKQRLEEPADLLADTEDN